MRNSFHETYQELPYITNYDLREIDFWVEKLENILENGALTVPTIPNVVAEAMKLANDPKSTLSEIEELVKTDQAISGKLIQIANSALFRGVKEIDSISEAITRMGQKELRMILFSAFVQTRMFRSEKYKELFDKLLRHSLSCASLSSYMAKKLNFDTETAYLAGFLHDVGMSALLFTIIDETEKKDLPKEMIAELAILCLHEKAGKIVAEKWNMPEEVIETITYHHSFLKSQNHMEMAALVQTADVLSYRIGMGFTDAEVNSYKKPVTRYQPMLYSFHNAINLNLENYPTFEFFDIDKDELLNDISDHKEHLEQYTDAPWSDFQSGANKNVQALPTSVKPEKSGSTVVTWVIAILLTLTAFAIFGWLYLTDSWNI